MDTLAAPPSAAAFGVTTPPPPPRSIRIASRRIPVVLPRLVDSRLHVAAVVITLHTLGQVALGFHVSVPQILAAANVVVMPSYREAQGLAIVEALAAERPVIASNVEHTKKCIEICYALGISSLRVNTGRWGTTKSFDQLMADRGIEPVLPGRTEDEGFKWCIDGIERCLATAEKCGVMLALENHWGLARTPEGLLRILNAIKSPWLGALMDTGNFSLTNCQTSLG